MREKGMSEEEIAAAFFVSVQVVKQRLRSQFGGTRSHILGVLRCQQITSG
jgi:hypothetical protein